MIGLACAPFPNNQFHVTPSAARGIMDEQGWLITDLVALVAWVDRGDHDDYGYPHPLHQGERMMPS
jgi:hypothetical protein